MIKDDIRFFPTIDPGQTLKQDWTEIYTARTPVAYRNVLMKDLGLHAKSGLLWELFEREALDWIRSLGRPAFCIDILSAYGDSFLASVHGMPPEAILDAWSSEETCETAIAPRSFACKTLGVDLSAEALAYCQRAGIFDDILAGDINNLDRMARQRLEDDVARADYVHLGAPGYIELDTFDWLIDAFARGQQPGYLFVAFNYVFMKDHRAFKNKIVRALEFVNCVGGVQRALSDREAVHFNVDHAFSTTWVLRRAV